MAPQPQNANSLLSDKMGALTDAITNLTQYMSEGAANAAASRISTPPQATWSPSGGSSTGGVGTGQPDDSTPTRGMQVATDQLSQRAVAQQETGSSFGTADTSNQESQAIKALTWQELGPIGGPVGALQARQYAMSRNLGFAGDVAAGVGGMLPGDATTAAGNQVNQFTSSFGNLNTTRGQLGTGGLVAGQAALTAMSGWRNAGLQLGYGTPGSKGTSFLGSDLLGSFSNMGATGEGASLHAEQEGLRGRWFNQLGAGLSKEQAQGLVYGLAGEGWSNQGSAGSIGGALHGNQSNVNGVNNDNARIAGALQPLVAQGVDPLTAVQLTPSLRNASDSIGDLKNSINQMQAAARATKEPMDQLVASITAATSAEESMGATPGAGRNFATGFTEATGMNPQIGSTLMGNPMVQAMAIGQNGVLPSGVPNLGAGAQTNAIMSTLNMLAPAFSNLNHNRYMNVPGVGRVLSQSGADNQAAQIGQMLGVPTAEAQRLLMQRGHETQIANLQTQMGQMGGGAYGQSATGIYSFLGGQGAQTQAEWNKLSSYDKNKATTYWNNTAGRQLGSLEQEHLLSPSALRQINHTSNIGQRMSILDRAITTGQGNQKGNQVSVNGKITLDLTSRAARVVKPKGKQDIKVTMNSGGTPTNSAINSPLGSAQAANNYNPEIGSGAQAGEISGTYDPSGGNSTSFNSFGP